MSSKYKGDVTLMIFFVVLALSVLIYLLLSGAIGFHQLVNIKQGVSLSYEIDNKGSTIASIMKATDSGKPVMEQIGMLFVKDYDKSKITSTLSQLFGAVYKNYKIDIFDGENGVGNDALQITGGNLKESSQAEIMIPRPGAVPGRTHGVVRIQS